MKHQNFYHFFAVFSLFFGILSTGCLDKEEKVSVAENQNNYLAFIAMGPGNSIIAVDVAAGKPVSRLPGGQNPHGIDISPDGRYLYAASLDSDKISVIDVSSKEIIKVVDAGGTTHHVAVAPGGERVYFTLDSGDFVGVLDAGTNNFLHSIPVDKKPSYVSFLPNGKKAYVTNMGGSSVSVIDTAKSAAVSTIDVGEKPDHIAVHPGGTLVYVANTGDNTISVIDTAEDRVTKVINVGEDPHGLYASPDGKKVFVANLGASSINVIDVLKNEVVSTLEVGEGPGHIAITPDGRNLIVNFEHGNKVLILDILTGETISSIEVDTGPHQIAISPAGVLAADIDFSLKSTQKEETSQARKFTEEDLSIVNSQGGVVEVEVTFKNPLIDSHDELVFDVFMNTHSVDLSQYDLSKLAVFKNSQGIEVSSGFVWIPEGRLGHHGGGTLKLDKEHNGQPLMSAETEFIILELKDIGSVPVRNFKWGSEFFKKDHTH